MKKLFAGIMIMLSCGGAHAIIACSGKIGYLGLDQVGQVAVGNGGAIHTICSMMNKGQYALEPQVCRAFYAALLTAKVSGKSVGIYYNSPNITSCSQIGGWSIQPSAYFLEVQD